MSLALKINPVEIPELLHIISCHLSVGDQKACMLVCRKWYNLFQARYWNHIYFNRQGIPHLDKYGHLVRRLTAYRADDKDLLTIAGSCHNVQQLELEFGFNVTNRGPEALASNVPHIQDLHLRVTYPIKMKHLAFLTHQKRLRKLYIGSPAGCALVSFNWEMLISALQGCPTLSSLHIEGLTSTDSWDQAAGQQNGSPPPPPPTSIISRWAQRFTSQSCTTPNTSNRLKLPAGSSTKEPWRKFTQVTTTPTPAKIPGTLLPRQLDDSKILPALTRLHMSRVHTDSSPDISVGLLFKMTPNLQDLHLNMGYLAYDHAPLCLDTISNNCHQLRSLVFEDLISNFRTSRAIHDFFERHRPTLRHFKLKNCYSMQYVLDLMPQATVAGLERVCFDSTILSHPTVHRFLARCSSLQYFTWTAPEAREIPPLNERMDAFVEPWACYETLRHVEQRNCIVDDASYDAFSCRLALMPRLVSLHVSMDDFRRLMASVEASRSYSDHTDDDDQESYTMETIQELTFASIPVAEFPRLLLSRQLNATDVVQMLKVFPHLRKIRYEGRIFPLDQGARDYLQASEANHISILHVSQLPSVL
ncbi:hypothetical protein BGX34_003671 [Mortierella sp. NVP85]|nr:hypothetical protein BGX34_003671 [Mortierella sp. NVP85]